MIMCFVNSPVSMTFSGCSALVIESVEAACDSQALALLRVPQAAVTA